MLKKSFFVLFFFLLFSCCIASEIRLKGKLKEAKPGSYIVIEQNKTFTFFHIYDRFDNRIVIEEATIPAASFAKYRTNWKSWFENGAPGHTAWIISQVNLDTGKFEESYSFTHKGWIDISDSNPFLTTLLNLRFQEMGTSERRRIGSPTHYNKMDSRPLWNPRLIVNGQMIPHVAFQAYKARWPSDGSELSRKIIEIYLPYTDENCESWYPNYFPYWLEVDGRIGSAKIRVIDSGMEARSPRGCLPKRNPQLLGDLVCKDDNLIFHLKSPPYYQEFIIMAEDTHSFFGGAFPIPYTLLANGEELSLIVSKSEFKQRALPGKIYRFSISPKENPAIVLETKKTIHFDTL